MRARLKSSPTAENYGAVAEWYADRHQFKCAADWFATASTLDPNSASLFYLRGLSLYSAGNSEAALPPLHRAAELDPKDIRPHLVLGAALDKLKRIAEADSQWRTALAIDPDSTVALEALSQNLLDRKDYPGVVALLEKPEADKKLSPLGSLSLGIALAATSRLENAANVLRDALAADQNSLPIADQLAMVLVLQGRVEEAYGVFDSALARHPDDRRTQVLYLNTLVTSNSDKAAGYAKKLLDTYPRDWEVLYLNGVVESREGNFSGTRELVEKSLSLNPGNPQAEHLLGSTLAKLGDNAGAREHLRRAIQAGDNQPEVHYELSKVMQRLGDSQGSVDEMQAYQSIKKEQSGKTQAAGKAEVADQEMRAGNAEKAAALYREAVESDPDESLLHYKLSKALDQTNDIVGEKRELQQAIALNPDLPEAQNQMGYLIAREGNAEGAVSYLRAAVRASPSYVPAWINLAATLASQSKWQEADDAIGHALTVDPGNAQAKQLRDAISTARSNP